MYMISVSIQQLGKKKVPRPPSWADCLSSNQPTATSPPASHGIHSISAATQSRVFLAFKVVRKSHLSLFFFIHNRDHKVNQPPSVSWKTNIKIFHTFSTTYMHACMRCFLPIHSSSQYLKSQAVLPNLF